MKPIFILAILLAGTVCRGQNTIGIPDIINYSKEAYNAGTQNRGIVQDKNGVMYFANYEGLLSFDGVYWKNYPLPNKTVVRSVAIAADNKIYAGGQGDFGFFSPDKNGRLVFNSLKALLPEKNYSFSDIWFIVPHGNDIFFLSRENIFQLNNKTITVYPAASGWQFLGESNNHLFAQDGKNTLLEFSNGRWTPFLKKNNLPQSYLVTCLFPFGKDSSFVGTVNTGFYMLYDNTITPFHFSGPNPFGNERTLTAIAVNKDWLAIGTHLDGVYIVNRKGEIIQNLSRKEGLQNNNVLKLFIDNRKNVWLGLDNGIDFIAFNNALKHIYPEKLNEGLGYTSIIYNNHLYVGTSNGLYSVPLSNKQDLSFLNAAFTPVPNSKGSTWDLSEINGQLLLGHHEGAYQVINEQLKPVDTHAGFWNFLPFSNVLPSNLIVAGTDRGIEMLKYNDTHFTIAGNLPGFNESARFMAIDNNKTAWVAHSFRGIYKIDLHDANHPEIKLYTEKNGLPSALKNHVFKVKGRIVVTTSKGVYEYNSATDKFVLSGYFRSFFGDRNIRLLKEDSSGNIWFIENNSLGVVDFSGAKPATIYFPELGGKMVTDFEHIYPYNKTNVFVGADKGFYHLNFEEYKKNIYPIDVAIRSVKIIGKTDSLLFDGYFNQAGETQLQEDSNKYEIANKWNSMHFEFSSPMYTAQSSIRYSIMLKGFDKEWSALSKKTEKDYTNLPAGKYVFQVKSVNNRGIESAVKSYAFTVLPPWYSTVTAMVIYAILFIGLNYLFFTWLRKLYRSQEQKHEEEQKRLQYLFHLELEKSEKEIVKLKNEKLEAEIDHKNRELASTAMHLVQKGELLGNFREQLMRSIKKETAGESIPEEFKKMLKILNEEKKMDKDWEQFAIHFDGVQGDFLKILKQHYPALSANEQKLCAYLRMNLSTKEIAQLENISVRGVEISRYRLRKKLNMQKDTNLPDFLLALHTPDTLTKPANGTEHAINN